ncbi:MAG: ArsA family ATPase [Deltaproteobacteria bacterium]|jgi:anion-transporting  ArsA/GET3 family ATPase|nr:ArsA family ATPase [Deltaproteobacteria bacterium]
MKSGAPDFARYRLIACLGPGGVGKTTVSAALAVSGAARGRSVDVMTVDPAPRLLDALGLDGNASEPRTVSLKALRPVPAAAIRHARLRALKLDPKETFDSIVRQHAPSAAARDAILSNRIYRNLSSALAGVGDYMAMEKLLELASQPDTDLVVLDTPPAAEALDFLDAPRRLLELLNSRAVTLLGAPAGLLRQFRLVDLAARAVLSAFDRVTGLNLLADVQAFVSGFEGMYEGFAERAKRADALLRAGDTALVLVTTPETGRIAQAQEFLQALQKAGLQVNAIVVNRAMPALPDAKEIAAAKLSAALKRKLRRNLADQVALKERETRSLGVLSRVMPAQAQLLLSPELDHEPRSVTDLGVIAANLRPAPRNSLVP